MRSVLPGPGEDGGLLHRLDLLEIPGISSTRWQVVTQVAVH